MLAYVITATIILLGANTLRTISRDALPNVNIDELQIVTVYPGGSAEDVEMNVTAKIEDELKEVDGIDVITSVSLENQSNVHVKLDRSVRDIEKVKREVRNAIDQIVDFPKEVTEPSRIIEISTDLFPVIDIAIASDVLSYSELREISKELKEKILDLRNVSSVREHGLREREVKIRVNEQKAYALQVSAQDVLLAIRARNIRASAGTLDSYSDEKTIVTIAEFETPQAVGDVIVRSDFSGNAIYVRDVAEIIDDFKDETERSRVNGHKAISFEVMKKASADIIRTADSVRELAEAEDKRLGDAVMVMVLGDQSNIVRNRMSVVINNGAIGLAFVLITLALLLNLRAAFWTAMGIPIALMGAVFFLPVADLTLSAIAMAGLIIVIGIVVDDAIVVSENITRHLEMGKSALDAAVDGTEEVFKPVLTTVLTTVFAFSSMFFIDGVMGDFVFVIPFVICVALLISFVESIFALPSHLISGFGGKTLQLNHAVKEEGQWFKRWMTKPFISFVERCLKFRYPVIVLFIITLVGSLYYAKHYIDFILFPSDTSEELHVLIELPQGSSLDATVDVVKQVEAELLNLPAHELDAFTARVGRVSVNNAFNTSNNAIIIVYLTPYNTRERGAREITKALGEATAHINAHIAFQIAAGGPPVGKAISLRVTGNNDAMRDALVNDIVAKLERMEAVSGIDSDNKKGKSQIEVKLDFKKLSELGLSVSTVTQNLRLAFDGDVATTVRYGDDETDFRVMLDTASKNDLKALANLSIPNQQGRLITLGEVARFEQGSALSIFSRYQGKRSTMITADVDIDLMTPLAATQSILAQVDTTQWPGMVVFSDGEADESQDSIGSLGSAFVISIVGILLMLILLFNSVFKPLVVLSVIPFGLIGVIWVFALHGLPLSFIASIGIIGLTGILVNDSLILVNFVDTLKQSKPDIDMFSAVLGAAETRFRPILITSLTTVTGLIPMAYGFGGFDPFMGPMALAMGYGVMMATPLTLVLVPCILLVYEDCKGGLIKGFSLLRRVKN